LYLFLLSLELAHVRRRVSCVMCRVFEYALLSFFVFSESNALDVYGVNRGSYRIHVSSTPSCIRIFLNLCSIKSPVYARYSFSAFVSAFPSFIYAMKFASNRKVFRRKGMINGEPTVIAVVQFTYTVYPKVIHPQKIFLSNTSFLLSYLCVLLGKELLFSESFYNLQPGPQPARHLLGNVSL
jgi:hypothetical protein